MAGRRPSKLRRVPLDTLAYYGFFVRRFGLLLAFAILALIVMILLTTLNAPTAPLAPSAIWMVGVFLFGGLFRLASALIFARRARSQGIIVHYEPPGPTTSTALWTETDALTVYQVHSGYFGLIHAILWVTATALKGFLTTTPWLIPILLVTLMVVVVWESVLLLIGPQTK